MDDHAVDVIVLNKHKNTIANKKGINKFYLYILYFILFSFIGWVLETLYGLYELGHFIKRGFLYGPICPIYGWGAIILIMFFKKYERKNLKLFIYAAILFSIFEYAVSYCMDALFAARWWDYSAEFFNLNGRISIFYSFVWGIGAILFVNIIFPFFSKKINIILSKISYRLQIIIVQILGLAFLVDTFMSFIRYLT